MQDQFDIQKMLEGALICQRCMLLLDNDEPTHVCTPTGPWLELEREIKRLKGIIRDLTNGQ